MEADEKSFKKLLDLPISEFMVQFSGIENENSKNDIYVRVIKEMSTSIKNQNIAHFIKIERLLNALKGSINSELVEQLFDNDMSLQRNDPLILACDFGAFARKVGGNGV